MNTMLRRFVRTLATVVLAGTAFSAAAQCDLSRQLAGVNLAGAEFNGKKIPARYGYDYIYPPAQDLAYFQSVGMNTIRLPFRWERLQPLLGAGLDTAELGRMRTVTEAARSLGMCVILDVHNYGAYAGQSIGSAAVSEAVFIDFWVKLAREFTGQAHVAFGLMNEPNLITIPQWASLAQRTVDALRSAGANNLLLVSGGRWSGAHEWQKPINGISNAQAFSSFRDPLNNFVFEVHQYANASYSGTTVECIPAEQLRQIMTNASAWARSTGARFFLGEFGVAASEPCLAALDAILAEVDNNPVWAGWTYWAAGRWWGTYPFSIHPAASGVEAPQLTLIRKYL